MDGTIFWTKIGFVLVNFFIGIASVCLPIVVFWTAHNALVNRRISVLLNALSCFAGGVFVATLFLDLLPGAQAEFDQLFQTTQIKVEFPLCNFAMIVGFLLILLLERCARAMCEPADIHQSHSDVVRVDLDEQAAFGNGNNNISQSSVSLNSDRKNHKEDDALKTIVLFSALCFHSLFEGMAIGFQKTVSNAVQIFLAISIHKGLVGFSLGINIWKSDNLSKYSKAFCRFIFSVMSPVGIVFGIMINSVEKNTPGLLATSAALQSISCGTFLYVIFMEILPTEFSFHQHNESSVIGQLECDSVMEEARSLVRQGSVDRYEPTKPASPVMQLLCFILGIAVICLAVLFL